MIKHVNLLVVFFLVFSCVACRAGSDHRNIEFENVLKRHCNFNTISDLSSEKCHINDLDDEIKSKFFKGEKYGGEKLGYSDLEVLVDALGLTDYALALASSYLEAGFDCKAFRLVKSVSDESAPFLYSKGVYYHKGICAEKDLGIAFSYYYGAAQKGHLDSAYNVALMYYFGKGVLQNVPLSGEIFSILAAFEHEKTISFVKMLIDKGYADEDNFQNAVRSRRPVYLALKESNSQAVLVGNDLDRFLKKNNINPPVSFNSLLAPRSE